MLGRFWRDAAIILVITRNNVATVEMFTLLLLHCFYHIRSLAFSIFKYRAQVGTDAFLSRAGASDRHRTEE